MDNINQSKHDRFDLVIRLMKGDKVRQDEIQCKLQLYEDHKENYISFLFNEVKLPF